MVDYKLVYPESKYIPQKFGSHIKPGIPNVGRCYYFFITF